MTPTLGELFERRSNNFNLMRLLAALAVICAHAPAITGHGPLDPVTMFTGKYLGAAAVDVFFVTSGFLVTASAMSGKGLVFFTASRILRIYPALVVCVALSVLVLGPLATASDAYWSRQTWDYFWVNATAYSARFWLPGVFERLPDHAVNGSIWSLMVEVRLYLGVFVAALLGLLPRRAVINLCGLILFAASEYVLWTEGPNFAFKYQLHSAVMFLVGSLAWINRDSIRLNRWFIAALLAVALVLANKPAFLVLYEGLLPCLVFAAAFVPRLDWYNRVGDYSYGVYLYGWPAQQLALIAMGGVSGNTANALLGGAFALLCGIVSWHLIEKPSLALKQRFSGARFRLRGARPAPRTDG